VNLGPRLRWDLVANFAGTGWYGLIQLVCIPFYVEFLGVQGYGLIAFYLVLQAMVQVLDFGVTPTVNREMARYSSLPDRASEACDLVRTLEVLYWLVGIAIGLTIFFGAQFIASHWIKGGTTPTADVRQAVRLMSVVTFLQWPVSFYQAGLIGLQRQVLANALKVGSSTLNGVGAVAILWLVSAKINVFFLFQIAASAIQVLLLAIFLWRKMPRSPRRPRFDFRLLRSISRFVAGMSGITISATVLTQLDKILLSKMLSLEMFGYYVLAGTFGRVLLNLISPVFNTIFPRFSALAAVSDEPAMRYLYRRCTQLMTVLLVPVATVLAFFPYEILLLWTKNAAIAYNAAPIARLLAVATALNGLMVLPYTLQLAYGWTGLGLKLNIFQVVTLVPVIWILATRYGAIGGAVGYLALMCVYMAMGVPLTHRRLLKGETLRWFADVSLTSLAVLFVVILGRAIITTYSFSHLGTLIGLSGVLVAAGIVGVLTAPLIRDHLLAELTKVRLGYV
jgi:O-antigen/teichoic acid export membrane protein